MSQETQSDSAELGFKDVVRYTLQVLIPILILVGGRQGYKYLLSLAQKAPRKALPKLSPFVETEVAQVKAQHINVSALGTVVPSRQVALQAQVAGRLIKLSDRFQAGAVLKKGDFIGKIDPQDYKLALAELQSQLADAELNLATELGRKEIAEQELAYLKKTGDAPSKPNPLAMRLPHIKSAQARVEAAKTAIERAKLNLARTEITAPFNCVVLSESTEVGQLVSTQTEMAQIVGTDQFFVRATLPIKSLNLLSHPDQQGANGSEANVLLELGNGKTISRSAHLTRVLSDLEPTGRLARVLVTVNDPLGIKSEAARLYLGAIVRVNFKGRKIENTINIPRRALRAGNMVWRVTNAQRLDMARVTIVNKTPDYIVVEAGLENGDRIITSRLDTPVIGMEVSTEQNAKFSAEPKKNEAQQNSAKSTAQSNAEN